MCNSFHLVVMPLNIDLMFLPKKVMMRVLGNPLNDARCFWDLLVDVSEMLVSEYGWMNLAGSRC